MIDWQAMLVPKTPLLETIVRGSIIYLSLFLILRIILKRESATLAMTDMLTLVLLANAVQNSMVGEDASVADGVILVIVIVGWSHFLNFLGHRFSFFEKLIKPPKLLLVKDGKMIRKNMRKEFITDEELMAEVRLSGISRLEDIEEAYIESTGKISVIAKIEAPAQSKYEKKLF